MTATDTTTEIDALLHQVSRQRSRSGPALRQAAFNAARAVSPEAPLSQMLRVVCEQIDSRLAPYAGGSRVLSDQQWANAYAEAEAQAQRELMEASPTMRQADELNRQAQESKRLADAAEAGLRRDFLEFLDIPNQADRLQAIFVSIAHEVALLDPSALKSGYQTLYRHALLHPEQDVRDQELATLALIVTSDWRREVLAKLESETNGKLSTLKKRNLELSKRLGRPSHNLG